MTTTGKAAPKAKLPADLQALFDRARPTVEVQAELKAHFVDWDRDPEFVAGVLRAQFVEDAYRAMAETGLNKNALSQRLGKTRQYVGRILNESANFTFRTIAEIACALGWGINVRMLAPDERLSVVRTVTHSVKAIDFLSTFKAAKALPSLTAPPCMEYKPEPTHLVPGKVANELEIAA